MTCSDRPKSCPFCGSASVVISPLYGPGSEAPKFLGHRVRCQYCGASLPHRAMYDTIERSQSRALAKWNRRAGDPRPVTDGIKRIPEDEITTDMPPEGIVRYILSASGVSWESFAKQANLTPESLSDHLSYMTLDTIQWLVLTFGYTEEFWEAHDVQGDRSITAGWRRWLRDA